MVSILIIVRHGQSQWNLENRFTGDVDVELTQLGREEAKQAGQKLVSYRFNNCFTSVLKRAQETLDIILKETGQEDIPIEKDKALNERRYGNLQGLNKADTTKQYGETQVNLWRRSFNIAPPGGESLKDTYDRVIPYYESKVVPLLLNGAQVLVVAHGNSLRALAMHLENISKDDILGLNIPTGVPKIYEFDNDVKLIRTAYL